MFAQLKRQVIQSQYIWLTFAIIALLIALGLGAIRQSFIGLLSKSGAIPVINESGQPQFLYLGDAPPTTWQQSPWLRACTWALVTTISVFAALVGALVIDQWYAANRFIQIFLVILVIRWLISSIPRLFFRSGENGQFTFTADPPHP